MANADSLNAFVFKDAIESVTELGIVVADKEVLVRHDLVDWVGRRIGDLTHEDATGEGRGSYYINATGG